MSAVVEHCAWGVHDEVQWGKLREKPLENQAKSNRSVSNALYLPIQCSKSNDPDAKQSKYRR